MSGLQKNVAGQNVTFCLVNATTGAALSGASVTTKVVKDGSSGSGAGTVSEPGSFGQYNYAPTQGETNAVDVGFFFTATNAVPVNLDYHTDVVDGNGYPGVNIVDIAGTASAATAGYTGPDWGHVNAPTSTVGLTGTTLSSSQVVASVTGAVGSVTGAVGSVTGNVGGSVGSVTGNVGGSVASVTGAVGSVTGNVGGSTASVVGAVGSVTGAVGSVTGNVGGSVASVAGNVGGSVASVAGNVGGNVSGNVSGSVHNVVVGVDVASINASTSAATQLALAANKIGNGTIGTGSSSTVLVTSSLVPTNAVAHQWIGRVLIFDNATTTTNLRGENCTITDTDGAGGITVSPALPASPVSGDTFTIT